MNKHDRNSVPAHIDEIAREELSTATGGFSLKSLARDYFNLQPPVVAARTIYNHGRKTGAAC